MTSRGAFSVLAFARGALRFREGFEIGGFHRLLAGTLWSIAQNDPRRRMVASARLSPHLAVHARLEKTFCTFMAQEQVIDAQACIPRPTVPHVIPERVHGLVGMKRPDGIGPALINDSPEDGAAFRLQEGVFRIGLGGVDIAVCGNDIEIAREHDRNVCGVKLGRVCGEAVHPRQLVREFRSRLRISVGRIQRRDKHAFHGSLDIAALRIVRIARQFCAGH